MKGDSEDQNEPGPSLEDLPTFHLEPENLHQNDLDYEIVFIDEDNPQGIDSLRFVQEELGQVRRLQVYVPMVVDATFNLSQRIYNGLWGHDIVSYLRHGTGQTSSRDPLRKKKKLFLPR